MPKTKETKGRKTKTTRIVKSAIAKGKGIAQNQSVVVNIQEKKKRVYKRNQNKAKVVMGTLSSTLLPPTSIFAQASSPSSVFTGQSNVLPTKVSQSSPVLTREPTRSTFINPFMEGIENLQLNSSVGSNLATSFNDANLSNNFITPSFENIKLYESDFLSNIEDDEPFRAKEPTGETVRERVHRIEEATRRRAPNRDREVILQETAERIERREIRDRKRYEKEQKRMRRI